MYTGDNEDESDILPADVKSKSSALLPLEVDQELTRALDRLVFYLRIVHSMDFYKACEYQQEDSMPNRCGIIFVRPSVSASPSLLTSLDEIAQYGRQFEAKLKPYLDYTERIEAELAKKLGIKEQRDEIDKFSKVKTQELPSDGWLCPLCGERFISGPKLLYFGDTCSINTWKRLLTSRKKSILFVTVKNELPGRWSLFYFYL